MKVDFYTKKLKATYEYSQTYKHVWHVYTKDDTYIGMLLYHDDHLVFAQSTKQSIDAPYGCIYVQPTSIEYMPEIYKFRKKIESLELGNKDLRKVKND